MSMEQRQAALQRAVADASALAGRCVEKYGPFASAHEAYGVLREELEEFFEHVRQKPEKRDGVAMRAELIDIAAAALRYASEIAVMECGEQKMIYLQGGSRSFRCECGSNVFTVIGAAGNGLRYRCNGCRATYTGEAS